VNHGLGRLSFLVIILRTRRQLYDTELLQKDDRKEMDLVVSTCICSVTRDLRHEMFKVS
jgi:hypothetical protein